MLLIKWHLFLLLAVGYWQLAIDSWQLAVELETDLLTWCLGVLGTWCLKKSLIPLTPNSYFFM
jgi:hypothetical protein